MGWACASDCGTLDTVTILSLNQARSYVKFLHVFLEDRVRDSSNQGRETAAPNPLQHVETKSGCTVHSQQIRTQECEQPKMTFGARSERHALASIRTHGMHLKYGSHYA